MSAEDVAMDVEDCSLPVNGEVQRLCHLIASRERSGLEKHVAELSRWQAHNTNARISVIAHPRYRDSLDERVQFVPLNTDRSRHHPTLIWRLASQIRAGEFQIAHGHGSKSAQLLAAVQKYTEARQIITRHNVHHPRDKLASAFAARIAASHALVANSRIPWSVIPLNEGSLDSIGRDIWQVYSQLMR